jgi:hypothetical protein
VELPARAGKYEREESLGGGMSHVCRARDAVIGRTVAVTIRTRRIFPRVEWISRSFCLPSRM